MKKKPSTLGAHSTVIDMAKKFWDEKNIELLKKLRAEGASYNNIAAVFGCTRSAAGGACHRFGLTNEKAQPRRPKQPIRAEDKKLPRNKPKPAPAPSSAADEADFPRSRHVFPAAMDIAPPLPEGARITAIEPLAHGLPGEFVVTEFEVPAQGILLVDLLPESCRWPLNNGGPFRFCGCRKLSLKGPYCAAHEARAGGGQPKVAWNSKGKSGLSVRNAVGRI